MLPRTCQLLDSGRQCLQVISRAKEMLVKDDAACESLIDCFIVRRDGM